MKLELCPAASNLCLIKLIDLLNFGLIFLFGFLQNDDLVCEVWAFFKNARAGWGSASGWKTK